MIVNKRDNNKKAIPLIISSESMKINSENKRLYDSNYDMYFDEFE